MVQNAALAVLRGRLNCMSETSRLGVLDWGIGGISIYKLIKDRAPRTPIIYLSDTGVTPYGKMSRSDLVSRLNNVIVLFKGLGVSHLIIGCNAASTAIPFLDHVNIQIAGMIETGVEVAVRAKPERLGLIGGRRTVVSGVYRKAFLERGISVKQRIAQPLSALIESGDVNSSRLREEAQRILHPIQNCSHILLACTHYPAIVPVLREYVPRETMFLDPAAELAAKFTGFPAAISNAPDVFLTTGDPLAMGMSALKAFGVAIQNAAKVPRDLPQHLFANGRTEN
jgi:glutamate racemase